MESGECVIEVGWCVCDLVELAILVSDLEVGGLESGRKEGGCGSL